MFLVELWRKVEDEVQHGSEPVANEQEIVAHPPALTRVQDEGCRDCGAKTSRGESKPEANSVGKESILHRNKLANDECVAVATGG